MKVLMIGDIFGSLGRDILVSALRKIRIEKGINFIVANAENIAHGVGLNEKYYRFLLDQNINVITLGNHSFRNADIFNFIDSTTNLVRPLNLPKGAPGKGYVTVRYNNLIITVFQVLGRTYMNGPIDCPFITTEELLKNVKSDLYICDFHGEATSEKVAYGLHFDGRINIICGTHTHVQTNDARILDKGTVYMSDLGMTGPLDGVIGVDPSSIIKRFITGMPCRHQPMETGRKQFCGLIVEISDNTQKSTNFEIVNMVE